MRVRYWIPFILTGLLLLPGVSAAVTIDACIDPYPQNPDISTPGANLIFVGTFCDGGACPPGTIVTHTTDAASQVGLPNVLGGARKARIVQVAGSANSTVVPGYGLTINHNAGAKSIVDLDYGETNDLNANLTFGPATALQISVGGDMFLGPRPVACTFTVTSRRGTASQATASSTQNLILDGVYTFPFASFAGVDFTDVDRIQVRFDSSVYSSVDFAVFFIQTDEPPTPVQGATWGGIKSQYR